MREYDENGAFVADPSEVFELAGERTLTELTTYFGEHGDAIQERVTTCLSDAKTLLASGHCSAAVLRAFTAAEVMVAHFVVRPLLSAAIMSSDVSETLTEVAFRRSNSRERQLVPSILRHWSIDIDSICLSDGAPVWRVLVDRVLPLRNAIAHRARTASLEEAVLAVDAVDAFEDRVVRLIGRRLGFFVRSPRWSDSSFRPYDTQTPDSLA